jgi:nitroimidazol reductase NimA-like FMN-containing flavoprotein (pyridoxamine 5'-phosphate oxidase superfamily)
MRRTDRAIGDTEAMEILKRGTYGVLSTASTSGQPHGVPLSYGLLEGDVCFHCALEGLKLENITNRPEVSLCVVGRTQTLPAKFSTLYESVIVKGSVEELTGESKRQGLMALLHKYCSDHLEAGVTYMESAEKRLRVFRIRTAQMTGKSRKE